MGACSSKIQETQSVNHDCPICQETGKIPNIAGRFFIINETECKCNGCNTVFEKSKFFKSFDSKNANEDKM